MAVDHIYKCCYFTFGRFQPPTIGHQENIQGVKNAAGNCDWRVYTSRSHDSKGKNPLRPENKVSYMKKMFRQYARNIAGAKKDVIECLQEIQAAGYDDATLVVGSDRVLHFSGYINIMGRNTSSVNSTWFPLVTVTQTEIRLPSLVLKCEEQLLLMTSTPFDKVFLVPLVTQNAVNL